MRSMWGLVRLAGVMLGACVELVVRRPATREGRAAWLHRLCRRALRMFGVEVEVRGSFPERGVLIANHQSYLDILVFASIRPCVFVSKSEVRTWPLIGWMTTMAGTVYVERGRGESAKVAGQGMREAAEAGLPVVLFPEGMTSDGEQVLKFHSGLLMEGLAAEQPVTAAYVRYRLADEQGGRTVARDVAYTGNQTLLPHVFGFLGLRGVRVRVTIAEGAIGFTEPAVSRKVVAVEARAAVCALG